MAVAVWTVFFALSPGAVTPAAALDLFTLWRRPEVPLAIQVGAWTDYRTIRRAAGRVSDEIVRLQLVGRTGNGSGDWIVEVLPLVEEGDNGPRRPRPGEGVRLHLDPAVTARQGDLADLVRDVIQWRDGVPQRLRPAEWRDDPLVSASLADELEVGPAVEQQETTRVVQGENLLCRQFLWAAADTQRVRLPHGELRQVTTREITAAVHPDVPLLGVVFAAERSRAESEIDPPSSRFPPPPPEVEVHTLELVGYGHDARPALGPASGGAEAPH
ncbi:MAG: hypothetical protein R6X25_10660 [Candidatus Krumholzibacteriia bacterium]